MNRENRTVIIYWAKDLLRLADNLEKEVTQWRPTDYSHDEKGAGDSLQTRGRADFLWSNAVQVGTIVFELCGLAAFDRKPRIKNAIFQVRSELRECVDAFKVPYSHIVLNLPYDAGRHRTYDVFFVKVFEKFCDVWITNQEDRRAQNSYYDSTKLKAQLHAKLMRELSEFVANSVQCE